MVNAVTGSDFLPVREPAREPVSASNKSGSTDFKDALHQASKGQKEDAPVKEESLAEEDAAPLEDGEGNAVPGEGRMEQAASNAAGLFPWMTFMVSGEEAQTIPVQAGTELQAAVQLETENGSVQQAVQAGEQGQTAPVCGEGLQSQQLSQKMQTQTLQEQPQEGVQPGEMTVEQPADKAEQLEVQEETPSQGKPEAALVQPEDQKKNAKAEQTHTGVVTDRMQWNPGPQAPGQTEAASESARADRAVPMEELPQAILSGMKEGRTEFEIRLEPEALGRMVIKASLEEGRAVVSILCSNPKTAELLSVHARELGAIMEANLGTPADIVLDRSAQENAAQDYPDGHAEQNGGREEQQNGGGRRQNRQNTENFLQQLRLGLV